ncbi:hypothetical protein LguiB_022082 [Lonicera macranthoides]
MDGKERPLKLIAKSNYIPKKRDSKPLGDDAHFICEEKHTIGVADGVGGCAKNGIDAGEYARELMRNCFMFLLTHENYNNNEEIVDPKLVLTQAFKVTNLAGSSTACLITLAPDGLNIVNVGDSGCLVMRNRRVIFKTPIQQHYFNRPYQLGITGTNFDKPTSAQVFKVAVKAGDIIVAGTDGLFDNLPTEVIEFIVNVKREKGLDEHEIATILSDRAYETSINTLAITPFMEASKKVGRIHYGGKKDDITVIVASVVPSGEWLAVGTLYERD